jgi:hypothetical protein
VVDELLLLATAPADLADGEHVFGKVRTPALHNTFIHALFVGFAHNLLLESYVSRKAEIERIHKGVGPEMLEFLFMYRARQTIARALRSAVHIRGSTRSGDKTTKQLRKTNRSRPQQLVLLQQTEEAARAHSQARLGMRGGNSLAATRRGTQALASAHSEALMASRHESLDSTCRNG